MDPARVPGVGVEAVDTAIGDVSGEALFDRLPWLDCRGSQGIQSLYGRVELGDQLWIHAPPGPLAPRIAWYQKWIGKLLYLGTVWVQV